MNKNTTIALPLREGQILRELRASLSGEILTHKSQMTLPGTLRFLRLFFETTMKSGKAPTRNEVVQMLLACSRKPGRPRAWVESIYGQIIRPKEDRHSFPYKQRSYRLIECKACSMVWNREADPTRNLLRPCTNPIPTTHLDVGGEVVLDDLPSSADD